MDSDTLSPHPAVYPAFPPFYVARSLQYAKKLAILHPYFLAVLLSVIRKLEDDDAIRYAKMLILPSRVPSQSFLLSLSPKDCTNALRACLIVYSLSRGKMVPHQGQLESSLASMSGRDSWVIARTGYGKTLCIAIPLLLQPKTITMTISPLKRPQKMQVYFIRKYGIETIAINEDTPNAPELWKRIENGDIPHLIVQPEQFRLNHGHLPRMARLLDNRTFVSKVTRVCVDEAHNIRTVGTAINGRPPFRLAWGALGELRARLSKNTSWQALSAMMPGFIYRSIHQSLGFSSDALAVRVSINRSNLIYATHRIIDGRHNMRNLECIVPQPFHPPMRLPKLVIFHGEKSETCTFAQYLNSRLPPALQKPGICAHYHSDMSPEYLEQTYNSFASLDGAGLDVPEIDGVINYGLPEKVTMRFQWEGRAGRSTTRDAFALTMIEPWVFEMDLSTAVDDKDGPDRPLLIEGLKKKNPRKQERIGTASVRLARCDGCKRLAYAKFFEDDADEALEFTCLWCCDGHQGNGFSLSKLLLGPIYEGTEIRAPTKRKRTQYRPVKQRPELVELLTNWVTEVHQTDELRFLRPPSFILDGPALKTLSMAPSSLIVSSGSVTSLLDQSMEWDTMYAQPIFKIIQAYDHQLARKGLDQYENEEDEDEDEDEDGPPPKRIQL
ncbi:P-loop containing nucleoside triphosphate hydrolase protein [Mycena galericulata]|nr:P-loop containing nucleoside triphosphate hydrolase protein [Mycena galericulata]